MGVSRNPPVRLLIDCIHVGAREFKTHSTIHSLWASCMPSNSEGDIVGAFQQNMSVLQYVIAPILDSDLDQISEDWVRKERIEAVKKTTRDFGLTPGAGTVEDKLRRNGIGYNSIQEYDQSLLLSLTEKNSNTGLWKRLLDHFSSPEQTEEIDLQFGTILSSKSSEDQLAKKPGSSIRGKRGKLYKKAKTDHKTRYISPFKRDPDAIDRANNKHNELQNELSDFIKNLGFETLQPDSQPPIWDLAWYSDNELYVAEVKSITDENETSQLRHGLGQLLHYKTQLMEKGENVVAVLAVRRKPPEIWEKVCRGADVILVWPGAFEPLVPTTS